MVGSPKTGTIGEVAPVPPPDKSPQWAAAAACSPPPGGLVADDDGGRGPRVEAPAYKAEHGPPPPPPNISPTGDLRKWVEEADLCINEGGTAVKPLAAPGPRMDGAKPRGGEVAQPGSRPGGPAPSLRMWMALDS